MPLNLFQRASNLRYTQACETFNRLGGIASGNRMRSGVFAVPAVLARGAERADAVADANASEGSAEAAPPPPSGPLDAAVQGIAAVQQMQMDAALAALGAVGAAMQAGIELEKTISTPFAMVPYPGYPALRVLDADVGLPHAHNHPPNLTPPNPVPIPLPSAGPVLYIPILSGAMFTKTNSLPSARCGDMGLGVWCGGYFPMFEVFFGSASVWIESCRAARLLTDMTKHCIFSCPKPSDPPMGPMFGTTLAVGSSNVLIGGMPMPSLFSLAFAGALKGLFRGAGAIFRRMTARNFIQRLMSNNTIRLASNAQPWARHILDDLERIARTRAGRELLNDMARSGNRVTIHPFTPTPASGPINAWANAPMSARIVNPGGAVRVPGNATVGHTPGIWANHAGAAGHPSPRTTSDAILFHELNHANNGMHGRMGNATESAAGWDRRWKNFEEYQTVNAENGYRRGTGQPQRLNYGPIP